MGYVYCIKHLPSGKLYIGSRTKKNCNISEFFNGEFKPNSRKSYWTSSKVVHNLLSADGKESFEIIFCRNSTDAYREETELLIANNAKHNINFLNASNNILGGTWSPSNSIWVNDGVTEKYINFSNEIPHGYIKGRLKVSGEINQKKGRTGKQWYNDGKTSMMLFQNEAKHLIKGRLISNKEKNFTIVKCPHCCTAGSSTNMKRYHFDNCILLKSIGEYSPLPRVLGCSKEFICVHCNAKVKGVANLNRWHNDKCKHK